MSIKFTQLPPAAALDGTEILCMVQNGISVQGTVDDIGALTSFTPEAVLIAAAGDNNSIDIGSAKWLLVTTAAGIANLTGFLGGTAGRPLIVTNRGPNNLVLPIESGSSPAPSTRIYGGFDLTLPSGNSQLLIYSDTLARWVIV